MLYDQLPGEMILASIPETAEKTDAGKYPGRYTLKQEQINQVLVHDSIEVEAVENLQGT